MSNNSLKDNTTFPSNHDNHTVSPFGRNSDNTTFPFYSNHDNHTVSPFGHNYDNTTFPFYINHDNHTVSTFGGNSDNTTFPFYSNHDNHTVSPFGHNSDNTTVVPVFRSVTTATLSENVTNVTTSSDFIDLHAYETSLYTSDLTDFNGSMPSYVTYVIYAIVIPVIGVIGVMLNVTSILVLRHSHFRSLGSFLIHALLIFDIFLLFTLVLVTTPGGFLSYYYPDGPLPDLFQPWTILDATQMFFVAVTPLVSLAHDLDLWCVVALLAEQYAAHRRPTWLTRKDSHGFGVKVVATFLAAGLLGRIVSFFKYIRRDMLYGIQTAHKKVCLSDYYQSRNLQIYDRYISFSVFSLLPLLLLLLLLVALVSMAILRTRHSRRTSGWEMDADEMGRLFKGVRSTRLALTLALTALCLHSATSALYILIVKGLGNDEEYLEAQCHVIPLEVSFDYKGSGAELVSIYNVLLAVPASLRFFTLCIGLEGFRTDLGKALRRK